MEKKKQVPAYVRAKAKPIKDVITFTVTRDDVKGSVVADYEECAGAHALCKLSNVKHAWVLNDITYLEFTDGSYGRGINGGKLSNGVRKFDQTAGLFPPGVYAIRPPTYSQTPAYYKKMNEKNASRGRETHTGTGPKRTVLAIR
jgi:hypothetical protein